MMTRIESPRTVSRWFRRIAALLCIILALAVVFIAGRPLEDGFAASRQHRQVSLRWSHLNLLQWDVFPHPPRPGPAVPFTQIRTHMQQQREIDALTSTAPDSRWRWHSISNGMGWRFSLPLWPFSFILAANAAFTWPRARKGRCRHCGYDLSGLRSAICPECGEAFARATASRQQQMPE